MKKFFLIIVSFIAIINISFGAENDYLEYADIPGTDIINVNGQIDGNIYRTYIDTGNIFYITGSDNKLHSCFKLIGTGYTEKLGEIYFQYEGMGSYICSDYKLRGVFKIGAGGWGYMEDLENTPEKWKNYLDKIKTNGYYYHNEDNNGHGTGQAFIDGIGFSNWDNVRTEANLGQYFSNINIISSIRTDNNINADGTSSGNFWILLKYNGSNLKNFKVDDIYFISGYDSDVILEGKKIPAFKYTGPLTTDDNGYIKGKISSLNGNKNIEYGLAIKIGDNIIIKENTTSKFKYPFSINLSLTGKDVSGKTIVGYTNQAKLNSSLDNIDSLSFQYINSKVDYNGYNDYFVTETGDSINIDGSYHDIKVSYLESNFYSGDSIGISYNISGDYKFLKDGKTYTVKNFNTKSSIGNLYRYGLVDYINLIKITNTDIVADGKAKYAYKLVFKDKNNIKINNLDFDISLEDINKKFNLNLGNTYRTGFFISTGYYDSLGDYNIYLTSYKPVKYAELKLSIKNIKYNGHYTITSDDKTNNIDNITFGSIIDSNFQDKILKINDNDNIKYSIDNNIGDTISNLKFAFTGDVVDENGNSIINETSIKFVKGKVLSGTSFQDYNFDILINSDTVPNAVIYSGYIQYNLDGNNGNKLVKLKALKKYSPLMFIESGKIKVIGSILTNKKILGGIDYIATSINPVYIKNKLKKIQYETFIRGNKAENISTDKDISLSDLTGNNYIYKCNNNTINLKGTYDHNINIYTMGCKINITLNIRSNGGHLSIYAFSNNQSPNIYENDGWDIAGNIYIKSNVKTIIASLFTEGSIFTYKDDIINKDNIFFNRPSSDEIRGQLYIKGKMFSKNTLGGGNGYSDGTFTIVNGKKVKSTDTIFGGIEVKYIAQAYDLSFLKNKFTDTNNLYDTGSISEIIKNKYNCSGNANIDNKICSTILVIEDVRKK